MQKYGWTSKDFVIWSSFRGNTEEHVRGFYSLPVANTHDTHTKNQTSNNGMDKEKHLKNYLFTTRILLFEKLAKFVNRYTNVLFWVFYLSIKETFLRKLKRFTRKLKILANFLLYKSFRKFHRVSIHSFVKQEQIAVKLSRIIYLFKRIFHIFLFFYMKM